MSFTLPLKKKHATDSDADSKAVTADSDSNKEKDIVRAAVMTKVDNTDCQSDSNPPPPALPELSYDVPSWGGALSLDFHFEVLKNGAIVDQVSLPRDTDFWVCGRAPTCDLPMDHASISRRHAILHQHGTFVNKTRIIPRRHVPVEVGSQVRFGESSRLYILQSDGFDLDIEPEDEPTKTKEAWVNPVKTLREWFEEQGARLIFKKIATEDSTNAVNLQVIVPAGIGKIEGDLTFEGSGPTRREAEVNVCVNACRSLSQLGELATDVGVGDWEEWKRQRQEEQEDEEDSFYDRTLKRRCLEESPMTETSLLEQHRSLQNALLVLKSRVADVEQNVSANSHGTEDELDLYMSDLESRQRSDIVADLKSEMARASEKLDHVEKILRSINPLLFCKTAEGSQYEVTAPTEDATNLTPKTKDL
ncbi:hypothetical protein PSACC_02380 [Paramicrosporidium saccamoebae]|uniref:FHA domain-containing protein n=1 Tax=Paramicrosporidium saccamoebae TaxID=1246581 RepID=A0A2H9TJ46_9FUNG|nr:hypothetical protein PSACC_02380 [Paramicrosporidium saccamoebae]